MVILDVIPLIPLPRSQPELVSYFHATALEKGTLVQVSYNNRKIKAVVMAAADIRQRKEMLKKQATFTLKKIDKILKAKITEEQIKKAQEVAEYYFIPLGLALRAVYLHPDEKEFKKYISNGPSLDLSEVELKNAKNIKIVDMRREIRDANYSIFSRHLKEALQVAQEEQKRVIIFIPRKGYANFLLCKDCGNAIKCPNCATSLVSHQNELRCHHCNCVQPIPKTCPSCKSYNLKPYGVGIDKVESELIKFFNYQNLPKPRIKQLIAETKKLPEDWDILLATQSIFKYRDLLKVPFLGIINADTLIHIPDYSAEEKLLRQTLALAAMAEQTYVQTYNPDDPALVAAGTGHADEFWQAELAQRKSLGYPPFVQLVKLSSRHRDGTMLRKNALGLAKQLNGTAYPPLIPRERGMYVWNILLKFPKDLDLIKRNDTLRYVPPDWSVDVDPVSVV